MKVASYINVLGIILSTAGTIFTLWTILITSKTYAGTWNELKERHIKFPKEKKRAIIGFIFIIVGGTLQIIGQFV